MVASRNRLNTSRNPIDASRNPVVVSRDPVPGHGFTFENTPDIQDELRAIFGRKVDVIEMGRIRNPVRRRAIMDSHRVVYAA
jgi:hypothetical protein